MSFRIIKTTSAIAPRRGIKPGVGSATTMNDGPVLLPGRTIKVRNVSRHTGTIEAGLYGMARKLFGIWWIVAIEIP